jgi:hypothetical protein
MAGKGYCARFQRTKGRGQFPIREKPKMVPSKISPFAFQNLGEANRTAYCDEDAVWDALARRQAIMSSTNSVVGTQIQMISLSRTATPLGEKKRESPMGETRMGLHGKK